MDSFLLPSDLPDLGGLLFHSEREKPRGVILESLAAEIAKFRLCPLAKVDVATPITSPFMLTTGLPLEPGEMGAVI